MRGDGKFYTRGNKIYVSGSIDGVFHRKATGKKLTPQTKQWVKNADPLKVLAELLGEKNPMGSTSITIEEYGKYVIKLTSSSRGKATQEDYLRILKIKIVPFFEGYGFEDVKPSKVVEFLEEMKASKLSGDRIMRIKNVLVLIFDHASDNGYITGANPVRTGTVDRVKFDCRRTNNRAYDFAETAMILDNAKGWLKVFLDISFKLGVRPGELMGMKWEDVDLTTGRIHVKRTIYKGEIKEIKDHSIKKSHDRIIYMFPNSLELLKNYYEVRPNNEWVFVNKDGRFFREPKTIVDYHFKPLLKSIEVEYKTLYSTRRSYATIMNFSGEKLEKIQETMGHSNGSDITEKHYIDSRALSDKNNMKKAQESEQLFKAVVSVQG